ncbi:MAG: aldo/keto reductase [Candidatus Latescibacteria bacterium]|nr:aldo/keto reductase [Candidatus Latescibacterota bacterium]
MTKLETRRLGRTEMRPKALGLGCAYFGAAHHTDRDAIEGIRRAIELGINFFDTSPLYGESERRVGLALENGWREKVYLQTKTGTHPEREGDYSAQATRWSVQNSLKLLKTDVLDAVLIHDPPDIEDPLAPGRALDELLKMKEEGIVRHIGIGTRSHAFHRRAIETGQIEIVLSFLDYTLLDQSVARTTIPLAEAHDVGIILASILGMGKLGGREPKDDPRAHAIWKWCGDRGVTVRHLAIQFCMALPLKNGIIMAGPGTKAHVEEVYEAATTEIPPEVWGAFKSEFGVGPI